MKYIKRPIVVEAIQLPAKGEAPTAEVTEWLAERSSQWESDRHEGIAIHTNEGTMRANPGDYIVDGKAGGVRELYPCIAPIFEATYDPVEQFRVSRVGVSSD